MTKNVLRSTMAILCAAASLLFALTPASAADPAADDTWRVDATIYLWGAGIKAQTSGGGNIDVPFDTILSDLDMTFMGAFAAHKGKWSFQTDLIYLDLSQENKGFVPFPGAPNLPHSSTITLKSWVVTPTVGHSLIDTEKGSLVGFAGARYLDLDGTIDLQAIAPSGIRLAQISESGSGWDGIVGVRGQVNLAPKWFLPYYLDIGTGDTKSTWQAFAGVGYRFQKVEVGAGYRYLNWNFSGDDKVFGDLNISGPMVGVKFKF